jgi:drug/metabolite transporter superfamily protein YnfA
MGYLERGIVLWPNEGITFLLGFGRAIQYPSNCRKIWYGAQTISRVPITGYCTFIEYFVLWTWIQHALNAYKLNWSFVSLWLSTWFAILPWKTLSKHNLQYPYIGVLNILIIPLFNLFEWTRASSTQYLHFILSSLLSIVGGLLQWQPCR